MSANNNNECNEFHVFGDCQYCDISKFDNCIECTGRVWDSDIGRHIQEDDDCDGGVVCKKCVAKQDVKPECCGKHCDETKGLKLGMGWNRWHSSVTNMITEQLWCENCYKDCVGNECKGCSEYYSYTEMTYKEGGAFGEALYCYDQYFCKSCITHINSVDYDPDEYK